MLFFHLPSNFFCPFSKIPISRPFSIFNIFVNQIHIRLARKVTRISHNSQVSPTYSIGAIAYTTRVISNSQLPPTYLIDAVGYITHRHIHWSYSFYFIFENLNMLFSRVLWGMSNGYIRQSIPKVLPSDVSSKQTACTIRCVPLAKNDYLQSCNLNMYSPSIKWFCMFCYW